MYIDVGAILNDSMVALTTALRCGLPLEEVTSTLLGRLVPKAGPSIAAVALLGHIQMQIHSI